MERKYTNVNGELYHAGIKGMKWGVRKKRKDAGDETVNPNATKKELNQELQKSKKQLKVQRGKTIAGILITGALATATIAAIAPLAKFGHDVFTTIDDIVS